MSITINILGRTYQIKVSEYNKDSVIESEKKVMDLINTFKSTYAYKDDKDLLAMAALQFASKLLIYEKLSQDKDQEFNNILEKVKEIERLFNEDVL